MGWEDYHLHLFEIGGRTFGDLDPDFDSMDRSDKSAKLNRVISGAGAKFTYEYDFGDSWRHGILVEKVLLPEAGVRYPVCVGGKRACPPEDCGGPGGYEDLLQGSRARGMRRKGYVARWGIRSGSVRPGRGQPRVEKNQVKV